ncbi:hypothetical protein B0A53_04324 [Rhodotorula sp. CCFEE 5036]|nr:hypothetical protein B0A53_04324 [Rhodotorula sp. CCFEE 5036]
MNAPSQVIILGSGIIGLCSAYEVLKLSPTSETKVVLVEASPGNLIAGGASSYAGGFIACGSDWHDPPSRALARLSWERHTALAAELNGPDAYGWRECGAVGLAVGGHGESRSKYRTLPGAATTEDEKAAAVDWLEGEREQLSTEGGVAQIDPALFCQHLLQHLCTAFADRFRVVFGRSTSIVQPAALATAASKVLPERVGLGKESLCVQLNAGGVEEKISFDRLLVACGPWSAAVCETLGLPPIPLTNLPGHSLLIRPASRTPDQHHSTTSVDLPPEAVFAGIDGAVGGVHASTSGLARGLTDEEKRDGFTRSPEFFVRRKKAGEERELVYVAGENSIPETRLTPSVSSTSGYHHHPLPNRLPSTVDGVRDLLDEACVGRLKRAAGAVSPLLKEENGAVIERKQFCYRPISSDRQPIIGALRAPDVFVATGHGPADISGLGMQRFTPSARL